MFIQPLRAIAAKALRVTLANMIYKRPGKSIFRLMGATLGLVAAVGLCRATLTTITISGQSMWPSMGDGDLWLAWRHGSPRVGRVALMREPALANGSGHMVKRLLAVNVSSSPRDVVIDGESVRLPGESAWAVGDNRDNSLDSRSLGAIPLNDIIAYPFRLLSAGNSAMDPDWKRPLA